LPLPSPFLPPSLFPLPSSSDGSRARKGERFSFPPSSPFPLPSPPPYAPATPRRGFMMGKGSFLPSSPSLPFPPSSQRRQNEALPPSLFPPYSLALTSCGALRKRNKKTDAPSPPSPPFPSSSLNRPTSKDKWKREA